MNLERQRAARQRGQRQAAALADAHIANIAFVDLQSPKSACSGASVSNASPFFTGAPSEYVRST